MADEQDASSASPEAPDFAAFEAATLKGLPTNFEPTKADAAPAKPVDQAASTDATPKPASEPGKPKEKGAKARTAELDAEIAGLQEKLRLRKFLNEELDRRPKDDKPADSSPAPVKAKPRDFERYEAMPDAPKVRDYEDYGQWSVDMAAFAGRKEAQELIDEYSQRQKREYDQGQQQGAIERMRTKGLEAHPDFDEVGDAAFKAGRKWPEAVARFVLTNEHGHEVAYALAKAAGDDALYARIADPIEFGMYVGEFLASQKAPAKKSTIPKPPDPPVVLGSRPHDTTDAEQAALAAGDFSSFEAALMAKLRPSA